MSPSALPLIAEDAYPSFQRLIPELLHTTYEEWLSDHRTSIAYRQSRNGSTEIPVHLDEFDRWLKEHREAPHLELLWAFAEDRTA